MRLPALLLLAGTAATCNQVAGSLDITYTGDIVSNLNGGVQTGTRYLDNIDIAFSADDRLLPGDALFVQAIYNNGTRFSDLVGDLQGADNIDAPAAVRLYELWYEHPIGGPASVKTGILDLNTEFDVLDNAQLFMHSSHGIGAELALSGSNGPSIFPVTTIGSRLRVALGEGQFKVALFDAEPGDPADPKSSRVDPGGGVLGIMETGHQVSGLYIYGGYWQYSSRRQAPYAERPGHESANHGWYVALSSVSRLPAFYLRFGVASRAFNPVDRYLGVGLTTPGLSQPHRFGIALAVARLSPGYREIAGIFTNAEASLELAYEIPFDRLEIRLHAQKIIDPAALPTSKNASIVGLRVIFRVP